MHEEDANVYGESRFIAIDMGSAGQVLVVIYTHRGENIRLILLGVCRSY